MKSLNKATATIVSVITFLGINLASAQHYHAPSDHSPSCQTMIQSLIGHIEAHKQCEVERHVDTSATVAPRGCAGHICGKCLSYHVDPNCSLCTSLIQFHRNSTQLADPRSAQYLQNLAYALQSPELRNHRFVIEGHASAEGSSSANLTLSQCRANAIFDFLVSSGVNPGQLISVGYGETQAQHCEHSADYLRATDRKVIVYKLVR